MASPVSEDRAFYVRWLNQIPDEQRKYIQFDADSNVANLVLECDLEICEAGTIAMESWIAGKPTVELILNVILCGIVRFKHELICDHPDGWIEAIEEQPRSPDQLEKRELQRQHLERWCTSPQGNSGKRIARIITEAVFLKKLANWSNLTLNDYRRVVKLHTLRKMGLPDHFDPFLLLKQFIFGDRYAVKMSAYAKAIRPRAAIEPRQRIQLVAKRNSILRRTAG
jgi:hypothetical protein